MPQYVDFENRKWLQLDDSDVLVPVTVMMALEGGMPIALNADQLTALRNPVLPSVFPLPAAQIQDLKQVTFGGFPTEFSISNFPAESSISNFPSTYPWTSTDRGLVNAISTKIDGLQQGAGAVSPQTLRVAPATDVDVRALVINPTPIQTLIANTPQQQIPVFIPATSTVFTSPRRSASVVRGNVTASTTTKTLAAANPNRTSCLITNISSAILFLAHGSNAAADSYTIKIYPDDAYQVPDADVQLQMSGFWQSATGSALVTEGVAA